MAAVIGHERIPPGVYDLGRSRMLQWKFRLTALAVLALSLIALAGGKLEPSNFYWL